MITITDKGAEKVHEFLAGQNADTSAAGLRVGVRGGGCSGFQYNLAFDEQRDGDVVFESHGLKLLVDGPAFSTSRGRRSTTSTRCRAPGSRSTTRTSSRPVAAVRPSASRKTSRSRPSSARAAGQSLVAGCGGGDDDGGQAGADDPARPRSRQPAPEPEPGLATGLVERNANLLWSRGARPEAPAGFGPWRDRVEALRPAFYRLMIDWAKLQPGPGQAAGARRRTTTAACGACRRARRTAGCGRSWRRSARSSAPTAAGRCRSSSTGRPSGRPRARAGASAPTPPRSRGRSTSGAWRATASSSRRCSNSAVTSGCSCATGRRGTSPTTRPSSARSA